MNPAYRFQFQYAYWPGATVVVHLAKDDEQLAMTRARDIMDKRYAKQNREPPVGWTLNLIDKRIT